MEVSTHGECNLESGRVLALISCFSAVLQATASGMLEMDLLQQIGGAVEAMAPRFVRCVSVFGSRFGWAEWMDEPWRCLVLFAEIMQDRFGNLYQTEVVNIVFECLRGVSSSQMNTVLKMNLQLLSLQKLGLVPSSVETLLKFQEPLSQLRLHPNHLVVANTASTYLCFLRHTCDEIVLQAIDSLTEELELLIGMLEDDRDNRDIALGKRLSESELHSLIKFDLTMLLCSVSAGPVGSPTNEIKMYQRSARLSSFILEKLNPFEFPIQGFINLQVCVFRKLLKLSKVEFSSNLAVYRNSCKRDSGDSDASTPRKISCGEAKDGHSVLVVEYLRKYSATMSRALGNSPVTVKIEALDWICTFGCMVLSMYNDADSMWTSRETYLDASIASDILFSVLDAAYDRDLKVRSLVPSVLEVLLQARLIHPGNFRAVSKSVLDKLGDPELSIKKAFARVLAVILPVTVYSCGHIEDDGGHCSLGPAKNDHAYYLNWKQLLALKQMPRKLHAQQLVSILSYISQRWKVPLSSWIQRLVFSCHGKRDTPSTQQEVAGEDVFSWKDSEYEEALLDKICPVNNLAAAWWLVQEAARHCVNLRLRTNLGGPTQTFAALERMLLDIPNQLLMDTEQVEGKYLGSSNAHLLPLRLLLDFVEALKKNVYNAYEGSSALPCPPKQSSLFFRANRKVCEEWFSRISEPMMNAGLALQCHDAVFHYCAIRLQELKNLVAAPFRDKTRGSPSTENLNSHKTRITGDILRILRHASLALCRSHEPEALIGLQKWVTVAFSSLFTDDNQLNPGEAGISRHFSWMTGLVYQAQGHYEKAAAHFSHLLQVDESLSSMGSDGIQFVIARAIESYTAVSDWKSLEIWLTELQLLRATHAGKAYSGALTAAGNEMNAIHALARFDEGDIQAAWGYLDLTPKSSNELTLDPKLAMERSEQMLLRSMLERDVKTDKVHEGLERAELMLDEVLSVIPLDGLTEAAACAAQLHCIFAFEEGSGSSSQDRTKQSTSILGSLNQVLHSPISRVRQDCSTWMKVHRVHRSLQPTSAETLLISQKLLSLARKQNNFKLAHRMNHFIQDHPSKGNHMKSLSLYLRYESTLLKYAEGKHEDALIDLWSLVRANMLSLPALSCEVHDVLEAKTCLKLSTWLRHESSNKNLRNILFKVREDFHVFNTHNGSSSTRAALSFGAANLVPDVNWSMTLEEILGIAAKVSCRLCPSMGKAWLSYASWCFSQARGSLPLHGVVLQSCFLSPALHPEISPARFQLTEEEVSKVQAVVTRILLSSTDLQKTSNEHEKQLDSVLHPKYEALVNSLVQQVAYLLQAAAGVTGFESSTRECPSTALYSQLQSLLSSITGANKNIILYSVNELVDIWWSLRQRRVSLFGHAAHGYFQYLSCSSSKLVENQCTSSHLDIVKEKTRSCSLRAMLYILHILLNYGDELRQTLEQGFATVSLLPWQEITVQLFARLSSHPKPSVREQLERIVIMLAKISPWSIVYPMTADINAYEGAPSEELQRIADCLTQLYPKLIQDVRLVIDELGSMTVLWEELWLSTLQDLHTDVMRRISMLKDEAARIAENSTLSHTEKTKINAAKYSAMMAPIIVALERRLSSTSREPQTDHEIWFLKEYGEHLKSAILAFKTPPASAATLGDVWRPFDAIATSLITHQRKSFISLREVAPKLALLSSSNVPMPGLEKQISTVDPGSSLYDSVGTITISSFCEQVMILSTKTKPKKLALLGSDGQKYTYLLKGREDLRLDARIMQLLQAVNSFLYSCTDTYSRSLAIRYYSVTPISGRAGLIQWVDNVTSIYSVYKSWQNRTQLAQLSTVGPSNMSSQVPPVPRPGDMFYGKIIPALKEKGIRRVISRKDWPHEVKRTVLLELMKETPRLLLWQELWCVSEGFKAFSLKAKRFSGTVAAMSMLGHILGLGDRHLDNILIDFSSGDVVHIDYNVCFDKGRRLKIPEIVPFRLTQTIESALGFTGTEGAFRANCEAVINVLRRNKDIILMLLEVFVWDPLVEWTRGDNHDEAAIGGEEKKGMELAVSLSLFASRVQEIRVPLQEHHDLLIATLPAVESALKQFLDVLNQYEAVSSSFYLADKERSSLMQHETSAKLSVAEATSFLEKSRASFEIQAQEFTQAKALAVEKAQEATMWVDQHGQILDALRSGSIPDAQSCRGLSSMEESVSLISAVPLSGVPLTIVPEPTQAQCFDLDREVFHFIAELESGVSCAIEVLHEYALALQRVLPLNYVTTSPLNGWGQILQLSVNNLSSDILSVARGQAAELITKAQGDGQDSVQLRHRELCQKMEKYAMEIEKTDNERSELMNSIRLDTVEKSKERLLSTFTKYMQSAGYARNEEVIYADLKTHGDLEEKKAKILSVLHMAANELYKEVKVKVLGIYNNSMGRNDQRGGGDALQPDSGIALSELEEQIEKCVLVAEFVNEVRELARIALANDSAAADNVKFSGGGWASDFQASLRSSKHLIEQMAESALPEIIRSVISYNSEVMDAFGSLSQIRGSIDTALENLAEVDLERASLIELDKNYIAKVGFITEQQLALEEASVIGRDHLSWEEAEELATQEEACKAQLDQLHRAWNEKDIRSSSLARIEANIEASLISCERYFSSLISMPQEGDLHSRRSKALLSALVKPFSELELVDQILSSYGRVPYLNGPTFNLSDSMTSGYSLSDSVWRFPSLLKSHSFFIWKVGIMDSILDSCIHDLSSSVDRSFGFDQLYNVLRNKLVLNVQQHVGRYMKERVAPALLVQLEKENENLKQIMDARKELPDQRKRDGNAVTRVHSMLEEYCNTHETARAARSAVSVMERQVSELTEALRKTVLEIVQMEWLHDLSSPCLQKTKVVSQNILGDDKFSPRILNLSRQNLLDRLQSSVSSIVRSIECLQACERTSVSAEGQLERAMGWACAGPNTGNSSVKSSGIPSEFHDHLLKRRQLLWASQEHASDIVKICTSVMEFESSRDGLFRMSAEKSSTRPPTDRRTWHQAYFNSLTRLDVTYHSFSRADQECKLAQNKMEAVASGLISASNELRAASAKAKSASGDLQDILAAMRDCAYEASVALASFSSVSKGHTVLTSECGSMLEEVLAITEGIHDVYSLGKEAAATHRALTADLSKANMILLPIEASLSTDVVALSDAISKEIENNRDISPMHGQALHQSYCHKLREACQSLVPLVPSLTDSVKELYSLLTKLARVSSLHAGNLHKALEGLGESQIVRSPDVPLSTSEPSDETILFDKEKSFLGGDEDNIKNLTPAIELSLQDDGWISPPEHTYTSSTDSSILSMETSLSENSDRVEQLPHGANTGEDDQTLASFTYTDLLEDEHVEKSKSASVKEEVNTINYASGVPSDLVKNLGALSLSNEITGTQLGRPNNYEKGSFEEASSLINKNEQSSLKHVGRHGGSIEYSSCSDPASRIARGKNAYALSVLRQVELKLEGRDIEDSRSVKISEQVDHLLKQATSIDNLCNMYEGWTPWI